MHQIYDNAGIAGGRTVLGTDAETHDAILGVNLWGVIVIERLTRR